MFDIIDLVLACVIAFIFLVLLLVKRKPTKGTVAFCLIVVAFCLALGFKFTNTTIALAILIIGYVVVYSITNIQAIRKMFISNQKSNKDQRNITNEDLYKKIDSLVNTLSKKKIGALITFERKEPLDEISKNGTIINAPITEELLETIFYPGTRLHDGAVIIKKNMIYAASVYFTPTTKSLKGKFGSRHRAAFGISEISDAVTVVVSEETGRISIAHNGNLEHVYNDDFYREFSDLMARTER